MSMFAALQIDIETDEPISKTFDTISSKYGLIDILINNAGKLMI